MFKNFIYRLIGLFLHIRLFFRVYWSTYNIYTVTLFCHHQISWVSFKCVPYASIIVLILWDYICICKSLEFCLFISRVISSSCHMTTGKRKIFISPGLNKIVISWLELRLNGWLIKESGSSRSITMSNLLCNVLIHRKRTFVQLKYELRMLLLSKGF